MKAALEYLEPLQGTYIHAAITRDYVQKTEQSDAGYRSWLQRSLAHLVQRYNLMAQPQVLDFGCGTGELTVLMNDIGYQATGVDLHEEHLKLAKILAQENNMSESIFVLNKADSLPFADNSFDIVTMFSVLEHLPDTTCAWLLPELHRVCRGVIYILVPNRLQVRDDHTGLLFVPWMPRWLATLYVKARGRKRQYFISEDGSWDVYYRSFSRIVSLFRRYGFEHAFLPDYTIYPPLDVAPPIFRIGKQVRLRTRTIIVGVPLPYKVLRRFGYPKEAFYPYLNLTFLPRQ